MYWVCMYYIPTPSFQKMCMKYIIIDHYFNFLHIIFSIKLQIYA